MPLEKGAGRLEIVGVAIIERDGHGPFGHAPPGHGFEERLEGEWAAAGGEDREMRVKTLRRDAEELRVGRRCGNAMVQEHHGRGVAPGAQPSRNGSEHSYHAAGHGDLRLRRDQRDHELVIGVAVVEFLGRELLRAEPLQEGNGRERIAARLDGEAPGRECRARSGTGRPP